jgi:predicted TIM-barrel fold metal-dependent hydrolase
MPPPDPHDESPPRLRADARDDARPLPRVDVHLHVAPDSVEMTIAILDEQRIAIGLNASGGAPGYGLEESMAVARATNGRLLPLCNLAFSGVGRPGWSEHAVESLDECKRLGGKGLKVAKYVGLGLTAPDGRLVPVDDPMLDVVFATAGSLGLPVLLHSGDPRAFFDAPTPDNERFEELSVHPGWSFHGVAPDGKPWPKWSELLDQFERRVARHPETTFVGAHFGNAAEDPDRVARMLDRHRNLVIDTAARVPEFGRHPAATMRSFFERYQDRILFGSDLGVSREGLVLGSGGRTPGTRAESRTFFERHWAYFETRGMNMAHPTPIQGRWTIDGIGLPRAILAKLYAGNAVRTFGLDLPRKGSESHVKPP